MSYTEATADSSPLRYHNYLALIAYLDDSYSTQMGHTEGYALFERISRDFTTECWKFRNNVDRNRRDYLEANSCPEDTNQLADWLYNPACFLSFGQTDSTAIVLLDDFTPMFEITMDLRSPVEQLTLAMCPDITSLDLDDSVSKYLVAPHDLFAHPGAAEVLHPVQTPNAPKSWSPREHPFQSRYPLLIATKYKLGALSLLGEGLLLQRAIFTAFAKKIAHVVERLAAECCPPTWRDDVIRPCDVQCNEQTGEPPIQCALLDTQGSAEIGTLIFCRNYSVGMAIVRSLRAISFRFVLDCMPQLRRLPSLTTLHGSMSSVLSRKSPSREIAAAPPTTELLEDNHILCGTYTTLAVAYSSFLEPRESLAGGYLTFNAHVAVNPGHFIDVERGLDRGIDLLSKVYGDNLPWVTSIGRKDAYSTFLAGRYDMEYVPPDTLASPSSCDDGEDAEFRALPLQSFLLLKKLFHRRWPLQANAGRQDGEESRNLRNSNDSQGDVDETGIFELAASMIIPFPRIDEIIDDKGSNHLPYMAALDAIRTKSFETQAELTNALRLLRVPGPLRRTIVYLYQVFDRSLGDPFLVDRVLDMYDIFETFKSLLTRHISYSGEVRVGSNGECYLSEDSTGFIGRLVSAMANALHHRIASRRPHMEFADISVDLRGGLSQLVVAFDAPLKCSLGILKRLGRDTIFAPTPTDANRTMSAGIPYDRTGVVTQLALQLGARVDRWVPEAITVESHDGRQIQLTRCLGIMQMNVGQVFNPIEFVGHLHEAGHLVFDKFAKRPLSDVIQAACSRSRRPDTTEERISEVFANIFCCLFVCWDDFVSFRRHIVSAFSCSPLNTGLLCETDRVARLAELLFRLYCVTEPIKRVSAEYECLSESEFEDALHAAIDDWSSSDLDAHADLFDEMIRELAPFYSDFEDIWYGKHGADNRECVMDVFRGLWSNSSEWVRAVWKRAFLYYQRIANELAPWKNGKFQGTRGEFQRLIDNSLESGTPLAASCLPRAERTHSNRCIEEEAFPEKDIDSLFLCCSVLRSYLVYSYDVVDANKRFHLYRNKDGRVDYLGGQSQTRMWNAFQLDPAYYGTLFSADPAARRQRVVRVIATLKSLWDISTHLRGRRMFAIIRDRLQEQDSDETHNYRSAP